MKFQGAIVTESDKTFAIATVQMEVMGDKELAAMTLEAIDEGPQKQARLTTRTLIQERLEQCQAMIEADTDNE